MVESNQLLEIDKLNLIKEKMTSELEATTSQSSAISTSLINLPPIFKKYFNNQDIDTYQYNIKPMIRITEFERWFETVYAWPLNVLRDP
uniref:Uncharacterized protein n=1 Tax=Romanomermis culicivorax TaxID=13658 RepID=A0A915JV22_ROMCU